LLEGLFFEGATCPKKNGSAEPLTQALTSRVDQIDKCPRREVRTNAEED
jgi:hypothetical protein